MHDWGMWNLVNYGGVCYVVLVGDAVLWFIDPGHNADWWKSDVETLSQFDQWFVRIPDASFHEKYLIRISANCHKYPYSSIVFSSLNYVGTTHTDSLTFNCQTLSFIIKIFFQTWFIIAPYPTKFNLFFYFLTPI